MGLVAAVDLCRTLHSATADKPGWADTDLWWGSFKDDTEKVEYTLDCWGDNDNIEWICPAYSMGYLLHWLPEYEQSIRKVYLSVKLRRPDSYQDKWMVGYGSLTHGTGNTPEDAACRLAITLAQEGTL